MPNEPDNRELQDLFKLLRDKGIEGPPEIRYTDQMPDEPVKKIGSWKNHTLWIGAKRAGQAIVVYVGMFGVYDAAQFTTDLFRPGTLPDERIVATTIHDYFASFATEGNRQSAPSEVPGLFVALKADWKIALVQNSPSPLFDPGTRPPEIAPTTTTTRPPQSSDQIRQSSEIYWLPGQSGIIPPDVYARATTLQLSPNDVKVEIVPPWINIGASGNA